MGTRGAIVFVHDGTEKTVYNHFDSYPTGLGADVLEWLRGAVGDVAGLRRRVDALRMVDEGDEPSTEDRERLARFSNPNVNRGEGWYSLLRETQGNPGLILEAGVAEAASDFPLDSLFCEWAYVVDLDAEVFEVYEGFQKSGLIKGRWSTVAEQSPEGYWPISLRRSWSFAEIQDLGLSSHSVMVALESDTSENEG